MLSVVLPEGGVRRFFGQVINGVLGFFSWMGAKTKNVKKKQLVFSDNVQRYERRETSVK